MIIDLRDYVPPEIFKSFGSKSLWFIDPKIINIHIALTAIFKAKIIVNTYHLGGVLKERGFRVSKSSTGAVLSQHRFGRAIDITVTGMKAPQAYDIIMSDPSALISEGCTTIEDISYTSKGNWVHLDCRAYDKTFDHLIVVMP